MDVRAGVAGSGVWPTGDGVVERLAGEKHVWMCTVRPDGTPHVTPVWFVFLSGAWWIGVDGGSVKVRNIGRSPWVSLALEDGRWPVVAEGRARVHRAPFPAAVTAAFTEKYAWDAAAVRRPGEERLLIEVPVRRWLLDGVAH